MEKTLNKIIILFIIFSLIFPLEIKSKKEIIVPDDFEKIQQAINEAKDGDTIIVKPGKYYENITINKRIVLKSLKGPNFTVIDSSKINNTKSVIKIKTEGAEIIGFEIKGALYGIVLENSKAISVKNNIINTSISIYSLNSNGIFILDNILKGSLNIMKNYYVVISNNIFYSEIYITKSFDIKISSNLIKEIHTGIEIQDSSSIRIIENKVISNFIGIRIEGMDNLILSNEIKNNEIGIKIDGNLNKVINNTISFNSKGVEIGGKNNLIFLNDFIKNEKNVNFPESIFVNEWFSPRKIFYVFNGSIYENFVGNYWGEINMEDKNGDGILDKYYFINENNTDHYPLAKSKGNYTIKIEDLLTVETMPIKIITISETLKITETKVIQIGIPPELFLITIITLIAISAVIIFFIIKGKI